MGLFSRSKSSTSVTNVNVAGQIDNNDGANYGVNASGVNGDVTVNMTDNGAVQAASETTKNAINALVAGQSNAFDFSENAMKIAMGVSKDAQKDAFRFGESAIDANKDVHRDAFNFGESALDANQHAIDESLSMVGGAVRDVTDLAGDVTKTAMEENRKANEAALAAAAKAQSESFSFGRDALSSNESISKAAMNAAADANKRAFDFGSESLSDALDSNESISNKAIEKMRENARDTVDLANDMAGQSAQTAKEVIGLSETFAGVTEKTISQSQTGASDSMMKLGIATAIAFSVAIVVRG